MPFIRWLKLLKEINRIMREKGRVKEEVNIHLSTSAPQEMRAYVTNERDEKRFDILLNAEYNKTEEDVIYSIAHELAHIITGNEHGEAHAMEKQAIVQRLNLLCAAT